VRLPNENRAAAAARRLSRSDELQHDPAVRRLMYDAAQDCGAPVAIRRTRPIERVVSSSR
jgi:hypothetical protein